MRRFRRSTDHRSGEKPMHRFCKNRYFFTISVPIAGFPPEPMIGTAADLPQYLDVTWDVGTIGFKVEFFGEEEILFFTKFDTTRG